MNTTSIVTVIFAAILLVGAIETIYQIYKAYRDRCHGKRIKTSETFRSARHKHK